MDPWKQYSIIVVSMAVAFVIGVGVFPFVIASAINDILPPPSPPFLGGNQADLMKQLQKQELAIEKSRAEHPCTGGNLTLRPALLCPEDNNNTRMFLPGNMT